MLQLKCQSPQTRNCRQIRRFWHMMLLGKPSISGKGSARKCETRFQALYAGQRERQISVGTLAHNEFLFRGAHECTQLLLGIVSVKRPTDVDALAHFTALDFLLSALDSRIECLTTEICLRNTLERNRPFS
ncbi:hypothetical protein NDU88_004769 [Pleurodeles waltl]|uniref:Uncharacterized protein n=1 Tax=Pleurodeles waltl TaxID=8319 RepID=A0AAV7TTH9_PLEWA|nr:hypothetical protein NDU88_004769 [Pleurodeles waltl]